MFTIVSMQNDLIWSKCVAQHPNNIGYAYLFKSIVTQWYNHTNSKAFPRNVEWTITKKVNMTSSLWYHDEITLDGSNLSCWTTVASYSLRSSDFLGLTILLSQLPNGYIQWKYNFHEGKQHFLCIFTLMEISKGYLQSKNVDNWLWLWILIDRCTKLAMTFIFSFLVSSKRVLGVIISWLL